MKIKEHGNGVNICPDHERELIDTVKSLSMTIEKCAIIAMKVLQHEDEEVINLIGEIADRLESVDKHDVEHKDCYASMIYVVEDFIKDKFLNADILKTVHIVFDLSICMAIADASDNQSLGQVYNDDQLFVIALGLNIIGEGVNKGIKIILEDGAKNDIEKYEDQIEDE